MGSEWVGAGGSSQYRTGRWIHWVIVQEGGKLAVDMKSDIKGRRSLPRIRSVRVRAKEFIRNCFPKILRACVRVYVQRSLWVAQR